MDTEELFDNQFAMITLEDPKLVYYKFVDTRKARSFVGKQPADRLLLYSSYTWLVEIKSSMDMARFPLKNIKKSQVGFGRRWQLAGALSIFIIHKIPTQEFFFVPCDIIYNKMQKGSASFKWEDLLQYRRNFDYEFWRLGYPKA